MLPAKLKTVGYTTIQIGKWHLGQHHPGQLPINRGFDHHFGYLGGAEDHYTNENGGCGECGKKTDLWRDRGPATGEAGGEFAAYKYDREALRVISTHDGATPLLLRATARTRQRARRLLRAVRRPPRIRQLQWNDIGGRLGGGQRDRRAQGKRDVGEQPDRLHVGQWRAVGQDRLGRRRTIGCCAETRRGTAAIASSRL